ncbi:helix-turn-helix transcriptional regulator [uncultured Clostridium sp.]|uniref:helix-turn-helix transcriptional regulator n=1 Tax=uncultured Clostridium sp. TaxID=59620 RepID=UPI0025DC9C3C|nr:helix-turn-helix transcriptional regulator [uncultured Clostridium sp.]
MKISHKNITLPTQPGLILNAPGYSEKMLIYQAIDPSIYYFYEIFPLEENMLSIPILPDGCIDIVFIINDNSINSFIIGTGTKLTGFDILKKHYIFGVRFSPSGFRDFFNINAKEIRDMQVDFVPLCKNINELYDHIFCADSLQDKASIFYSHLQRKKSQKVEKKALLDYCIFQIINKNEEISINKLSEETLYSTRYIEKLFNETIGLSPKSFLDIYRIQNVICSIQNVPEINLLKVACEYGYTDQSHMNKHFKKYLSITANKIKNNHFFSPNNKVIHSNYIL